MTTTHSRPSEPENDPLTAAPAETTAVRTALVPVSVQIRASEGVEAALSQLQNPGVPYVAVTEHDDTPVGVLTAEDIEQLRHKYPDYWSAMRCGNAIVAPARFLEADEPFDTAVELLRDEGVRPLLVLEGEKMAGVLEPTVVFQWCAEHRPDAVEALAQLARRPGAVEISETDHLR